MKIIIFGIVLLFFINNSSALDVKNCCPGKNYLGNRTCWDSSHTMLNCSSKYLMEIDDFPIEEFADADICQVSITEDGPLIYVVCVNEPPGKWVAVRAICATISVIFVLATLTVYFLIPSLRDLQGICIMHSLFALAVALSNLTFMQISSMEGQVCVFFSFFFYYSFMVTFFWLNIVSFHVWKSVVKPNWPGTDKQWYYMYLLYGYGASSVLLMCLIISHYSPGNHLKPGFGEASCWFIGLDETFAYFYGPISVLLAINFVLFIWCTKAICMEDKQNNTSKIRSNRYKVWLYVRLFLVMGLMWIFEIMSAALDNVHDALNYLWIVTDYINCLQGILIFFLLVVFRKKVRRGLANRGLCGIKFPTEWKTLEDEESIIEEVESHLSNAQYA